MSGHKRPRYRSRDNASIPVCGGYTVELRDSSPDDALQTGKIVLSDSAKNLAANEMVRKAYLGGE